MSRFEAEKGLLVYSAHSSHSRSKTWLFLTEVHTFQKSDNVTLKSSNRVFAGYNSGILDDYKHALTVYSAKVEEVGLALLHTFFLPQWMTCSIAHIFLFLIEEILLKLQDIY